LAGAQLYFTDDDGKTFFPESAAKIPPFDHSGKQAVEAIVYKCDGKEPFVNHMKRFTPEAKKQMESMSKLDPTAMMTIESKGGMEVKSPGQKDWVKTTDPKHLEVIRPKCSDMNTVELVRP
jgi:hypothetical protein